MVSLMPTVCRQQEFLAPGLASGSFPQVYLRGSFPQANEHGYFTLSLGQSYHCFTVRQEPALVVSEACGRRWHEQPRANDLSSYKLLPKQEGQSLSLPAVMLVFPEETKAQWG